MTVYLIEEAFELVEAIEADDTPGILEELGDVLFQVIFLMYLYQQAGRFSPTDVLARNLAKMIHRHPHVFGSDKLENAAQVKERWREIKQQEKGKDTGSILDSVPSGLPALMRAYRISERAAGIGFDWDTPAGVMDQTEAEWKEFKEEVHHLTEEPAGNLDRVRMEFGDVLFTMINVARLLGVHPESALSASTSKFIHRFKQMEKMASDQGKQLGEVPRQEMERLWSAAKEGDETSYRPSTAEEKSGG
jgi:tetrapyrrole methylase family protein/MazG family protein